MKEDIVVATVTKKESKKEAPKETQLEASLKRFLENKALAETHVGGDPRTVAGRLGMQRQAQANMEAYEKDLTNYVLPAAHAIFVVGPKENNERFVGFARSLAPCVVISGDGLARQIAEQIAPSMGSHKAFGVNQFSILVRELRQLGIGFKMDSIPAPTFRDSETARDLDELTEVVGRYLGQTIGPALQKMSIEQETVKSVIENKIATPLIPVIIPTDSKSVQSLGASLFSGNFTVVETEGVEVDVAFTKEVFSNVKKQHKKN